MDTDRKRRFELVGWINRKDAAALFSMTRESKGIYLKKRIADVRAQLHAKLGESTILVPRQPDGDRLTIQEEPLGIMPCVTANTATA